MANKTFQDIPGLDLARMVLEGADIDKLILEESNAEIQRATVNAKKGKADKQETLQNPDIKTGSEKVDGITEEQLPSAGNALGNGVVDAPEKSEKEKEVVSEDAKADSATGYDEQDDHSKDKDTEKMESEKDATKVNEGIEDLIKANKEKAEGKEGKDAKDPKDSKADEAKDPKDVKVTEAEDMTPEEKKKEDEKWSAIKKDTDKKVNEGFEKIFSGTNLAPEFKDQIKTLFKARVNEATEVARGLVREQSISVAKRLATKSMKQVQENLKTNINSYLKNAVTEWANANAESLKAVAKIHVAESFMIGLGKLLAEHKIVMPNSASDTKITSVLAKQVNESASIANAAQKSKLDLERTLLDKNKEIVLLTESKSLNEVETGKLRTLCEGIEFGTTEDYRKRVQLIKGNFFVNKETKKTGTNGLQLTTESVKLENEKPELKPVVESATPGAFDKTGQAIVDSVLRNF